MQYTSLPDGFTIQELDASHLEQFNALLRYAFQVTEEELVQVGWQEDEIKQSKFPILESAHVLGCFEGKTLAAQIAVYPMQVNVEGALLDTGFVTGVATYPEYAGIGLMSTLIRQALTDMRGRGQSISFLCPYSIPFYRHKGWEIVSDKMTFRIRDNQLPKPQPVPGKVRRIAWDDPSLAAVHDRFAAKTHGCLVRNALAWDEYWRWDVDDEVVAMYYDAAEEPQGYLVYLLKREIFKIKEMVYLNDEARRGMWDYVTAHYSMVTEVSGCNYTNHSLAFTLEDSDIRETVQPYVMARIVDFAAFIMRYNFAEASSGDAITFRIHDKVLDWNEQEFTVRFHADGTHTLSAEPSPYTAEMSIGTATCMLMGYKRPAYLKSIDRLTADAKTTALLERLIPTGKAYFSDYI